MYLTSGTQALDSDLKPSLGLSSEIFFAGTIGGQRWVLFILRTKSLQQEGQDTTDYQNESGLGQRSG
jgi:hypothetical protein